MTFKKLKENVTKLINKILPFTKRAPISGEQMAFVIMHPECSSAALNQNIVRISKQFRKASAKVYVVYAPGAVFNDFSLQNADRLMRKDAGVTFAETDFNSIIDRDGCKKVFVTGYPLATDVFNFATNARTGFKVTVLHDLTAGDNVNDCSGIREKLEKKGIEVTSSTAALNSLKQVA